MNFDGKTYDPEVDGKRLTTQFQRVSAYMMNGEWHTIPEIVKAVSFAPYDQASEGGVSARLRDFRKEKFGSHTVNRRRKAGGGTFEYQLIVNNKGK